MAPLDDEELERRRMAHFLRSMDIIDEHGWMVQGVFPTEDTPPEQRYNFCYTVGLADKKLPEFIVYGLDFKTGGAILNDLAARSLVDGVDFSAGTFLDDVIVNYRALLIEAADTAPLGVARALFGEQIRALQLVFQDKAHRWPWQPGYEHARLPVLGEFTAAMKGER